MARWSARRFKATTWALRVEKCTRRRRKRPASGPATSSSITTASAWSARQFRRLGAGNAEGERCRSDHPTGRRERHATARGWTHDVEFRTHVDRALREAERGICADSPSRCGSYFDFRYDDRDNRGAAAVSNTAAEDSRTGSRLPDWGSPRPGAWLSVQSTRELGEFFGAKNGGAWCERVAGVRGGESRHQGRLRDRLDQRKGGVDMAT